MTRLLVLQPDRDDPPARLGEWLTAAGAVLDVLDPAERPVPDTLDGYRGVVCLGGAMGALDDAEHPWLADVRRLLSHAVSKRVPVLAICLGAQLLAVATGGQVRRAERPEIGVRLVAKRDVAGQDPLFADLPWTPDVLQFHLDEVSSLPPTATLLASSPVCVNQAFRVGDNAYGVQFHIETAPEDVLKWAEGHPGGLTALPQLADRERLTAAHEDIREVWQPFAERFVRLAGGELTIQRNLPLV
ncbi:type 1 glutamine amidotransferase [Saccharothrix yanglingensis]|uniref:type 1 glutamine amidotransferase n=1 Tax=Saccharothrix yanglingensis TaxID=659496 RepID=UPI0027D24B99|nr:type 1 glutamine amidotransferase [Saccharothrix yanglingensis]